MIIKEEEVKVYNPDMKNVTFIKSSQMERSGKKLCVICGKYFHEKSLHRHIRYVHGPKRDEPNSSETNDQDVVKTMAYPVLNVNNKIEIWEEKPVKRRELSIDSPREVCNVCGKTFHQKSIKRHMKIHSKPQNSEFEQILDKTENSNVLQQIDTNEKSENETENPPENECQIETKNPPEKKFNAGSKNSYIYKCPDCPLKFQTDSDYEEHLKTHELKTFPCDPCGLTFTSALKWSYHNFTHLNTYKCPICNFQTKTALKTSIQSHIRRHEGKFVAFCDLCDRGFLSKHEYSDHLEIHMDIPKYKCEFCDKSFSVARYLKVHRQQNHQKELFGQVQIYQCHVCAREFTFEKSLKNHLSVIHKEGFDRTVNCPVCDKKIANNFNLKKHMRIHTGEIEYFCDLCGVGVTTLKSWRRHKNRHLREQSIADMDKIE